MMIADVKLRSMKIQRLTLHLSVVARMEGWQDLRAAADILKNRKVAARVVLKIVPATDNIWKQALRKV